MLSLLWVGLQVLNCEGQVLEANQPKNLEGIWLGSISIPNRTLRMAFQVSRETTGGYSATLSSLDQQAFGIPVKRVTLKESKVRFEIPAIGAVYEGHFRDPSHIDGKLKQGEREPTELALQRVEKLPVQPPRRPQEPDKPYPYHAEDVVYRNQDARVELAGTLTFPKSGGPFPAAILIPGSGPSDRDQTVWGHKKFLVLADYLTRRGIAVLRSDDRGVGESTGDFDSATIADLASDTSAAVAYLKSRSEIVADAIGLVGHSLGGDIAPLAAVQSPDVAFIVLMAGSASTMAEDIHYQTEQIYRRHGASDEAIALNRRINESVFAISKTVQDNRVAEEKLRETLSAFDAELAGLSEEDRGKVQLPETLDPGFYKMFLSPVFRHDLFYSTGDTLTKVSCPVLALHGELDTQVSPDNLRLIREALNAGGNTNCTVELLPGVNHVFQVAKTGAISEYRAIEETLAPHAMKRIADWILEHSDSEDP
jgi:pimeloyl-ACP methyl ester carboxylesterase